VHGLRNMEGSMSERSSQNRPSNVNSNPETDKIQEKNLERMEALLQQSAMGIHILFDNHSIAEVMRTPFDNKNFTDFDIMKKVQDMMTELIAKKTYFEKISYLRELDKDSYNMLVRTYFHIVDNTVKTHPH
jgi:hypothetical protein